MKLSHLILVALISALVALASLEVAKQFGLGPASPSDQPAFARVMKSSTLHCVYGAGPLNPAASPDRNAKRAVAYDVMAQVGRILHLKIIWDEDVALTNVGENLANGHSDMLCMASWPTGPRDSLLDFTVPIDYMPIYAYVRADDTRFDGDLSKINDSNVTIATLGNKVGVVIAEEDDPLARQYEVTQDTDNIHMLLAVTTKKADVAFAAAFMGADFMKNNLGSLKQVANVGPVRVFGESFAVAKGETKLRDMMNVALVQLQNSGFTRAVLDKYYTEHKGLYFYPAKPWEP